MKSLSDLAGTDVYIHNGTPEGVFREIGNALVRKNSRPTVQQIGYVYMGLQANLPEVMAATGAQSRFEARVFRELRLVASGLVRTMRA